MLRSLELPRAATLSSEYSHCILRVRHSRGTRAARRKPCLGGSEQEQAAEPTASTKSSLPNLSITAAGTGDGTRCSRVLDGGEDGHAEVSVRQMRTENRRAGGAGLGLGGKSWAGEARVTGVQSRHFRAPRWWSWSGRSLRNRTAIRSGLQVKKGLSTDRAAEQGPAETRHWRGSRPERQEVNSTTMKDVSPSSC